VGITLPISLVSFSKIGELNGLVEPIIKARGVDGTAILRQKMDFILIGTIADQGIDLSQTSRRYMRRLARKKAHLLPESYTALGKPVAWAKHGGAWPLITPRIFIRFGRRNMAILDW